MFFCAGDSNRWYLSHLANMSTIAREWLALHAFPSLPFADTVMSGKVQARAPHSVWELPPPLLNAMNAAYNGAFFLDSFCLLVSSFVVRRSRVAFRLGIATLEVCVSRSPPPRVR